MLYIKPNDGAVLTKRPHEVTSLNIRMKAFP